MYAHSSNEPQYHIEQSLKALQTIEDMEETGAVEPTQWRTDFKATLESTLVKMRAVYEDEDSSASDEDIGSSLPGMFARLLTLIILINS